MDQHLVTPGTDREPQSSHAMDLIAATADGPKVIIAKDVFKRYGDFVVTDHIDLEILQGETLAILGPNGAGKTTFVEMLEGFRKPDSGTITVLGHDPHSAPAGWRARIGVVLQTSSDGEVLSAKGSLDASSVFYKNPVPTAELLADVGLSDKANTKVRHLSGGQRRRLDVARALIGRPDLIFVDEPTTGFDPEARREFWDLLNRVKAERGATVVLTTHYLDEAAILADRIAVLVKGRLIALDTPERVGRNKIGVYNITWKTGSEQHHVESQTPFETLAEIRAETQAEITDLTVNQPSLEDIYLELIRSLSDTSKGTQQGVHQ